MGILDKDEKDFISSVTQTEDDSSNQNVECVAVIDSENDIIETTADIVDDDYTSGLSGPTTESIKEAFLSYNLTDEDGIVMLELIDQYQQTRSPKGIYKKLPQSMKTTVDSIIAGMEPTKAQDINCLRNNAVGFIFDELLHDAKVSDAFDSYKADMTAAMNEINESYVELFHEAFEDTFSKIDEIKAENPEQAETILKVKNAFEAAYDFSYYMDWLDRIGPNKLTKWANRFDDDSAYFNNRLNSTFLNNVPSVKDLLVPIKANLPVGEYTDQDITKFLGMICHRGIKDDINDIAVIAYYYRFITDIYSYTFTISSALDERGTKIFDGIKGVIDKIKSL